MGGGLIMALNKRLLLVVGCLTLCGCGDDNSELAQYVEQVKQNATGTVEKIPEPVVIKNEEYTAESLRSPFASGGTPGTAITDNITQQHKNTTVVQQQRPDIQRPREYLEQFPLTELVMVGTLSKPQTNWGLIRDGKGMVHVVKVGDYIGQNSGKIIAITRDQVRVSEIVPDGSGGWMQSRNALNLVVSTKKE